MLAHQLPDGPGIHPPPASRPAGFVSTTDVIRINPPAPPAHARPHTGRRQPAGRPPAASIAHGQDGRPNALHRALVRTYLSSNINN